MPNVGADSPFGGLRGLIMRTPGQRQQNFALESLMNEAAAAAHADPIQFRLQHTSDPRLINILKQLRRKQLNGSRGPRRIRARARREKIR